MINRFKCEMRDYCSLEASKTFFFFPTIAGTVLIYFGRLFSSPMVVDFSFLCVLF